MATGLGVDLHPYYQRGTNALPGVEYGWLKMCDGAKKYVGKFDGREWTADAHAALFRRLGIPFGGYVYAQPGDGAAEARVLWAECQRLDGTGVAPGVDIESGTQHTWSASEARDHGRAFCAQIRKLGVRPAVYMGLDLLQATNPASWPEDPVIWAPRYGARPDAGGRYTHGYDVHQYSSTGSLPGSAGAVDWNQSYRRGTTTPGTAHLITTVMEDDMFSDTDRAILQRLGTLFPAIDSAAITARHGHNAGSLTNAVHSTWEQLFWQTTPAINGLAAALAETAKNPDISLDAVRQIVNDAVAQHVQITGTVQVGPAPAEAAQ